MAQGLFDFYRGTVPVFRSDIRSGTTDLAISDFWLDIPLVPSLGDPHPENFGVLRARDGSLALEPNDFDGADAAPYLWDVRRLATGMALAAMVANPPATDSRQLIVRAAMEGYRSGIADSAGGRALERVMSADQNPIIEDAFRRSVRDQASRAELDDLTILEGTVRKLKRGRIDPEDDQSVFAELSPSLLPTLPPAIERYRTTLLEPPPADFFRVLDAVRVFGSGIASWPRVRVLLLVRGPTEDPGDDILLELKESADSGVVGLYPPGIAHDSISQRILISSRDAWARPDAEAFWGMTEWLGLPCQIRLESEGQKGINTSRLEDELAAPEALASLGRVLGRLVARAHVGGPNSFRNAKAIEDRIASAPERFIEEQIRVGIAYAELVKADHERFIRALRREGPRLGIPFDPADTPSADLQLLYGTPPSPPPVP